MNPRHLIPHCGIVTAIVLGLFGTPTHSTAQSIAPRFPLVVDSDHVAQRLFDSIKLDAKLGQTEPLFAPLQVLRELSDNGLIEFEADLWISRDLAADLLVDEFFDDGQVPPPLRVADEQLSTWRKLLLRRISPRELMAEGDRFWLLGDLVAAGECWHLSETFADGSRAPLPEESQQARPLKSELGKRLIVWNAVQGRLQSARRRLHDFVNQYPAVEGSVAGRTGNLGEILTDWLAQFVESDHLDFVYEQQLPPNEFGRFDLVGRQWSVDLRPSPDEPTAPVFWNDVLLIHDQSGVRALDRDTGKSRWPTNGEDPGFLLTTESVREDRLEVRMASGPGLIVNDLWILRVGLAQFVTKRIADEFQQSRLFALDLEREGRIAWTLSAEETGEPDDVSQWMFSGSPQVDSDHVIVPLRSSTPDFKLKLLCLNAMTGERVWSRAVGATLGVRELGHPSFADSILIAHDCVYWNINRDAIVCADAKTGDVQWIKAIRGNPQSFTRPKINEVERLSGPLLVHEQTLLASTVAGVTALNAFTGETRWTHSMLSSPTQLAGEADGVLIVTGPGITAIDVETGHLLWSYVSPEFEYQHTHAVLSGRSVIWSTGAEIWTIDTQTGRLLQRDFYEALSGETATSATLRGEQLLISGDAAIMAVEIQNNIDPTSSEGDERALHNGTNE